jgi:hypothetical protein
MRWTTTTTTLLVLPTLASAWVSVGHDVPTRPPTDLAVSRRDFWTTTTAAAASGFLFPNTPASAGLLEDYGTDPSKIRDVAGEERERQKVAARAVAKAESDVEPNLRANYYYPTNKKRYLPRIKRCNDAIPDAADAIGTGDWLVVTDFANKIADDTILPMRLYTSSLVGGGTNVKVAFAKEMNKAADDFEKAQKKLVKATAKQDREASSVALEDLATALQTYRVAGKLLGPDGGGDIPSVDDIRRSACRVQGRTFEQRIKQRDSRVLQTNATPGTDAPNNGM